MGSRHVVILSHRHRQTWMWQTCCCTLAGTSLLNCNASTAESSCYTKIQFNGGQKKEQMENQSIHQSIQLFLTHALNGVFLSFHLQYGFWQRHASCTSAPRPLWRWPPLPSRYTPTSNLSKNRLKRRNLVGEPLQHSLAVLLWKFEFLLGWERRFMENPGNRAVQQEQRTHRSFVG